MGDYPFAPPLDWVASDHLSGSRIDTVEISDSVRPAHAHHPNRAGGVNQSRRPGVEICHDGRDPAGLDIATVQRGVCISGDPNHPAARSNGPAINDTREEGPPPSAREIEPISPLLAYWVDGGQP